ncbi:winged helix DNA-binding domain-containing protein [Actinocorallia sp. API 0066]|nr:winged helix DNA-binding domain-containing protein [Actinocorallia sp. API 0066]
MPPYFALWSRVADFAPERLVELLVNREVVRATLMRCTVHLVTADDCLALRPAVAPVIDRQLTGNPGRAAELKKIDDLGALAAAAREYLKEPRGAKELGAHLAAAWPQCKPAELARIAQFVVPVLQTPPRGVWGKSAQPAWTAIEDWLDRPLERPAQVGAALRRYLAAYGPASVADMQKWSGLGGLAEVVAGLDLRTYRDEAGRVLYDLPDATLPAEDAPAPVRFLAEYDSAILSHADRARIIDAAHVPAVVAKNGIVKGTFLVDGFVRGVWSEAGGSVSVTPFVGLSAIETEAVEAEGAALAAFAAPGRATPRVTIQSAQ